MLGGHVHSLRSLEPAYLAHQPGTGPAHALPLKESTTLQEAISDLPVDPVTDLNATVAYATRPQSTYQRWARGEIGLVELLPQISSVTVSPPLMFAESAK